jgi:exopolyphosphatase / guanosine-5'-triphosphate,3'-diphosphate pyrophosphatase
VLRPRDNRCVPDAADPTVADRPSSVGDLRGDGEIRAAIDLGTNSFHLIVARVEADGQFDLLTKDKQVVRLGSGAGELRTITSDAMERGLAALDRFARIAEVYGATIDAVGTSALREATNRDEFVRRARDEIGIDVDVVAGAEEARLIHLGVIQTLPVFDERILVVDIGGGSTEFAVGEGADVELARSLKLGAIRLTDRFFPEGRVRSKAVTACRDYVRSFLTPAIADVRRHLPFRAVGSSGTILNLARIVAAADGRDPDAVGSGDSFSRSQLRTVVSDILARRTAAERADILGLDEKRRDIIPAGAILLEEIFDLLELEQIAVSDGALREGILLDRAAARNAPGVEHRLGDIRRRSVTRMAATFHEDTTHIERSTDLALQLFDGLRGEHGLDDADRDLLEAAGLLHNVGLFISHAAHHRHSYYVIRNTDQLDGFTDREIELIAQIARYHRKSQPKSSHDEFTALTDHDRRRVELLAGILRVGIALDRSRRGASERIAVQRQGDAIVIDVRHASDIDMSLERYAADERLALLGSALDRPVHLRFTTR